ncbi:MAG: ACP S-malonyltransferase, partial [FCB group bacterium]|nr:ACP S-malonyltransferase [FCB group bacterium]
DPDAIAAALPEGVDIANFNGPQQTIISGTKAGIEAAQANLKAAGAKRVLPLPVSGPFHSSLMAPAAERFRDALKDAALRAPRCRFVSSVSGGEVSDPEEIRALLGQQICAPVRWTDVLRAVGAVAAVEAGPGTVLQGIAKRMDGAPTVSAAGTYENAQALGVE